MEGGERQASSSKASTTIDISPEHQVSKSAGRLRHFSKNWENLSVHSKILHCVRGMYIPFVKQPRQNIVPVERKWSNTEKVIIMGLVDKLLLSGAISIAAPSVGQFVSNIFTVQKPDGSYRLILNLKTFNQFVKNRHFKIEDCRVVARMISPTSFMAKIDLKDAYHSIPIQSSHRKYLRFFFNGTLYEYNCLPFGLSCAPLVFTKVMKPVAQNLRERGVLLVIYLDDFLILGNSFQECQYNVELTKELLTRLGFIINYDKSSLVPSKICNFLGFIYNSQDMTVTLPKNKKVRLIQLLKKNLKLPTCSIRDFAKFLGTVVSACPAIKYGFRHTKLFERHKYIALQRSKGNYDTPMSISSQLLVDLKWFLSQVPLALNHIRIRRFDIELFTDASRIGWGAYCRGGSTNGFWSQDEQRYHINYLELLALFFGLQSFAADCCGCNILCRVDNTTALACVNRMGSVRFTNLNSITQEIWSWCEQKNVYLVASYINSKDNREADRASREVHKETEWSLSKASFQRIVSKFGQPSIDLFASRLNKKCSTFVSWKRDPEAIAVDAFTMEWNSLNFYAFPPFSMVLQVLQKIIEDEATGLVVVPLWTAQPWYPIFKSLLTDEPLVLPPNKYLLSFNRTAHPLWETLSLVAGKLSGKPCPSVTFRGTR